MAMNDRTTTQPRNMSFKNYKKMKLGMLDDFCVQLTSEEKTHFNSLKTEIAVDNFCISAINKSIKTHI